MHRQLYKEKQKHKKHSNAFVYLLRTIERFLPFEKYATLSIFVIFE